MNFTSGVDMPYQECPEKHTTPANESHDNGSSVLTDGLGQAFIIPNYTIQDLRNVIPKHCYERSTIKGLWYISRDMACVATIFHAFHMYATPEYVSSMPVRAVLWATYTFIQGLFCLGLWVLGHECGHQTISPSGILNDTLGFVIHSALLAPYFSWKISHRKHHQANGNMETDVVWVPPTKAQYMSRFRKLSHQLADLGEETPAVTLMWLLGQQLIGWPNYLLTNATGRDFPGRSNGLLAGINHFNPRSPLFDKKDTIYIILSDLGIIWAITTLVYLARTYGWANMFVWYFVPYLWVNHWLAAITFLQHTDPSLPRYTGKSWTYVRGAAATIDRDFGFIGRHIFHGIIETHVLHHYISTIPFYHAQEASDAIRSVMGRHYRSDTRGGAFGFISALWRNLRMCQWVEQPEGVIDDVLFFRNRNGLSKSVTATPS